ncbi:MAG: GtrA family protein [Arachidicoccus sp.]|nr:GtrA family protein [Arachidicoccus sp.]
MGSSIVDFVLLTLLVEFFNVPKFTAGVIGLVAGGIINFIINLKWVFHKEGDKVWQRALKYFLVWAGNFFLNAVGYKVMLHSFPDLHYFISRVIVSLFVGIFYNYVLQRWFVFK